MEALRIVARLAGPVSLAGGSIGLDALLAAAVAVRDELPPAPPGEWTEIEVPLEREPAGRFHLTSFAELRWEGRELRRINQRFPLAEAQDMGGAKVKRVDFGAGPTRSYRIPLETGHVERDELVWWCSGDAEAIRALLAVVGYVGKKRSVGYGRVVEWAVEPCEAWPGFPVVRDGRALRPLPPDWPGLVEPRLRQARLTYPYWSAAGRTVVAWPEAPP